MSTVKLNSLSILMLAVGLILSIIVNRMQDNEIKRIDESCTPKVVNGTLKEISYIYTRNDTTFIKVNDQNEKVLSRIYDEPKKD